MHSQVPQVDYRANPSFASDIAQGCDSPENPNAAPAVYVGVPGLPDPEGYIDNDHPALGYVQEGLGLHLEHSIAEQQARFTPDVAARGYRSW